MPLTRLDAQQSPFALGPHVGASPRQDGGVTHVFVVVLHFTPALQSLSARHPTHWLDVPKSLHLGVAPAHAVQLGPQLASVLHSEHMPAPEQA